jgi:hypothetical protein
MIEMPEPNDDEVSAYHEAGYAVFDHVFNFPLKYITIEKPPRTKSTLLGLPQLLFNLRGRRIALAAGIIVQRKYFPTVLDPNDDIKDRKYFDTSCKFCGIDPSIEREEVESFIYKHLEDPGICHKIEILSHELLKKRKLYGDEINKILDAVDLQKR